MMARTHAAFGFFVGLFFISGFTMHEKILFMSFVVLGSLLTDIDHPKSKIGNKIKPVSNLISFLFGHRGFFHSIWIPLGIFIIYSFFFKNILLIAVIIGYISHLIIDAFTTKGINFIHPFQKLHMAGFIETGTIMEKIVFISLVTLSIGKLFFGWGWNVVF